MEKVETKSFLVTVLLTFAVVSIVLIGGCIKEKESPVEGEMLTPIDSPKVPSRGFFMGVLPTTAQGQSFESAYAQASQYSEFVPVWGKPTPFYKLADDLDGDWGKTFVTNLIRGNNMFPIVHLSFIGPGTTLIVPPGMENASLSDPVWRAEYKKSAKDVVKVIQPRYLSLGNEVNKWYERFGLDGPNGFKHFVTLYEEIYADVKSISPETKVFCIFAREIVSENREANLDVLNLFDSNKMDLLVFTSYPYAVQGINTPSDIPDDYYSKASNYMPGKPFGFSEIAWPSLNAFGGERAQADFIYHATRRLTLNQSINLVLFGWPWLHDIDQNDTIGLIKIDGSEKLAYEKWKELSGK